MTEDDIRVTEAEWRESHPACFAHPELKEGEMCSPPYIRDDFPERFVGMFKENGLHARLTQYQVPNGGGLEVCFIIVNIREQILEHAALNTVTTSK